MSDTPETQGIIECLKITWSSETSREHFHAAKEAAVIGIENLETQRDEALEDVCRKNYIAFALMNERDEARAEVERLRKALDERSFRAGWDARDANYGNLCPPTVEEVWLQQLDGGDQIGINGPQHVDTEQKEVVTFLPTQPEMFSQEYCLRLADMEGDNNVEAGILFLEPEIFEAHGREWYRHDECAEYPCSPELRVIVLMTKGVKGFSQGGGLAKHIFWDVVIGWRPADAPAKLPRK